MWVYNELLGSFLTTDYNRYAATTDDDALCVVCRRAAGIIVRRLIGRLLTPRRVIQPPLRKTLTPVAAAVGDRPFDWVV